jgi:hypothetical protein
MVQAVMAISSVRAAEENGARPYRGLIVFLVFLLGFGAFGTIYMFHRRSAKTQESIDRVPSSIKVRRGRSLGQDGRPAEAFGGLGTGKARRRDRGQEKLGAITRDASAEQEVRQEPDDTDEAESSRDESNAEQE